MKKFNKILAIFLAVVLLLGNGDSLKTYADVENTPEPTETAAVADESNANETATPESTPESTPEATVEPQQAATPAPTENTEAEQVPVEQDNSANAKAAAFSVQEADDAPAAASEISLTDIKSKIEVSLQNNDKDVNRKQTELTFKVNFEIDPDKAGTSSNPGVARTNGVWYYDLGDLISIHPELEGLRDSSDHNMYEGSAISGTYRINGNRFEITPNKEWLNSKGKDGIKGSFYLSFSFDGTKVPEGGNKEYKFPGATSSTTVKYENVKVTTDKTVNSSHNGKVTAQKLEDGNYKLSYSLTISADADMSTMKLTDKLTGSQTFDENSFHISGGRNPWIDTAIPSTSIEMSADKKAVNFDLANYLKNLPEGQRTQEVRANQAYTITYDTIVPASKIGKTEETNNASWTYDGNNKKDAPETKVTTNKRLAVTKNVSETGGNTYTYTVEIGDHSESLAGHKITDTMSDNQVLQGEIHIEPALPDGTTTISASSKATDNEHSNGNVELFNFTLPDNAANYYKITYTTIAATDSSLYGNQKITNKTDDEHGDDKGGDNTSVDHDFGVDRSKVTIDKKFAGWDVNNKKAKWTIKLTIPDDTKLPLNNVDVQEQWPRYGYGTSNSEYTPTINWDSVVVKNNNRTFNKGSDYTIDQDARKIHFNTITPEMGRSIVITLDTTLQTGLTSDKGGAYIGNTVSVYVDNQYKDSHYDEGKFSSNDISMTKNVTGPDDNGLYTWTVEINPNQDSFDPDIIAYFKDILPEGMEFAGSDLGDDKISVKYENPGQNWWYNNDSIPFTVNIKNNTIGPVQITGIHTNDYHGKTPEGLSGTKIQIEYKTRTSVSWRKQNNGKEHTFTNKAQVTNSDGTVLKETTGDVNYVQKYLDKKDITPSGNLESGHLSLINYEVDINPDAIDLTDGDYATLTDNLAENVELVTGSIKLIDAETNQEINNIPHGISYDDKTRTLTILIPDEKHVKVQYSVHPMNISSDGTTPEEFTNTAVLHGKDSWSDEEKSNHVVINHSAEMSGNVTEIKLQKVSKFDVRKTLKDAEFTLYKAELTDNDVLDGQNDTVVDKKSTDANGEVTFNDLTPASMDSRFLYYWVESKAPNGYGDSDDLTTKHYFVLYNSDDNAAVETENREKAQEFATSIENANNGINVTVLSGAGDYTRIVANSKNSFTTATIHGTKTMKNRAMANGEFTFKVTPLGGKNTENDTEVAAKDEPMPANSEITVPEADKRIAKDTPYSFDFGEIKYTYAGTFRYKVEEVPGSDTTIDYNNGNAYEVTVNVKRNNDGDLQLDGDPVYTYYGADISSLLSKADFVNTQKVGDIEVTKKVEGVSGDKTKRFGFTITMDDSTSDLVKNADYAVKVTSDETKVNNPDPIAHFVNGTVSFNLASGQKYHIYGIPAGTKYTVTEDGTIAQGYKTTVDNNNGLESAPKTVEENKTSSTSFVNTKNASGKLVLHKTLNGDAVTDDDKGTNYKFNVHIDGDGDLSDAKIGDKKLNFTNRDAEVEVKGNGSIEITGLPLNAPYTVTEDEKSSEGFTSTEYKADGNSSQKDASGNVSESSSVEVINTKIHFGGISLQKKVDGNDKYKKTWFAFRIALTGDKAPVGRTTYKYYYGDKQDEITFVDGVSQKNNIAGIKEKDFNEKVPNEYVTLKVDKENNVNHSPKLYITGLPEGVHYEITEQDYTDTYNDVKPGDYVSGTVKSTNKVKSESVTPTDIDNIRENNAVYTNKRDAYGQLKISKRFVGNAAKADEDANKTINVKLTIKDTEDHLINGEHFGYVFKNGSTDITLDKSNDYQVNIEKTIPVGYKYKVEETTEGYEKDQNNYVYVTQKDDTGESLKDDNDKNLKEWCEFNATGNLDPGCKNMASDIEKESIDTISPEWHWVELVNTKYAWGGFSVHKTLTGSSDDRDFKFHIELSDNTISGDYGTVENKPITFENGSADFSMKAGETAYVFGLNNGVHYKVTEELNNPDVYTPVLNFTEGNVKATTFTAEQVKNKGVYTRTSDGIEIFHPEKTADQVEENLPAENKAVINNVRKSNSLTITKTLKGNDTSVKGPFKFTVYLKHQNGTPYNGTEALTGNGKSIYTDKDGYIKDVSIDLSKAETSTYTLNNLEVGTTYEVTETESKGYTPSYENATGTISDSGSIVDVTNTKDAFGGLKVTKTVEGNAADKSGKWKFKLTFNNGLNTDIHLASTSTAMDQDGTNLSTLQYNESEKGYVFWLSDQKTLETTQNAIPAGTEYTVDEVKDTDDSYTTTKSNDKGIIVKNSFKEASFTNTRSVLYSLTLKKFVNANIDEGKSFKFTINLNPYDGKTFEGPVNGVEFKNNSAVVYLKANEAKTLNGLPNGTYTVTESDADDYSTKIQHTGGKTVLTKDENVKSIDGQFDTYGLIPDPEGSSPEEKVLNEEQNQTLTFTNSKTVTGSLIVTKKVAGENADPNARFKFAIRLTGAYGRSFTSDSCGISGTAYQNVSGDDLINTLSFRIPEGKDYSESDAFYLGDNNTLTVNGLPSNATYEVVELDNSFDGIQYERTEESGVIGSISPGSDAIAKASITNTLLSNGKLKLKKEVTGTSKGSARFYFDLKGYNKDGSLMNGDYGDVTFKDGSASVDIRTSDKGTGERTLTGLPIGSRITVNERDYTNDGYDKPVYESSDPESSITENGVTVTITGDSKDNPITITTKNNKDLPSLKIKKTIKGLSGEGISKNTDIVFHVTGDNGYSKYLHYNTDFDDEEKKNGKILSEIPYGTYTVEETGGTVEKYHLITTYKVDGNDTNQVSLTKEALSTDTGSKTKTIEITNQYYKKGGFKITKNVTVNDKPASKYSDDSLKKSVDGTYRFDILDSNLVPINRHVDIKIVNGESTTAAIDDLDAGVYYVQENLAESHAENIKNMKKLPALAVQVKDGVTSSDADAKTVSFTNNLEKNGSLAIEKKIQVNGSDPENQTHNGTYSFLVESEEKNADCTAVYSNRVTLNVNNGKSGSETVNNLKPGKYTITEDPESDQNIAVAVTYSSQNVEVKPGQTTSVSVTNDYSEISRQPQIIKIVDGDAENHDYTFTISPKDGAPMPLESETTQTVNLSGNHEKTVNFGNIKFTKAGTYEYQITENANDYGGFAKNEQIVTASITLTNVNGKLVTDGFTYSGGDGDQSNTITNTYTAKEVQQSLSVTKNLSNVVDQNDETHWPKEGFTFNLTASDKNPEGATLPATTTATATKDAKTANFDLITFTKEGTYYFKISEVIPNDAVKDENGNYVKDGITYSTGSHTAVVDVKDDHKGQLVANVTYDGHDSEPSTVTNSYGAAGTWSPTAVKTVDGKKPKKSFGFELTGENKNAKDKLTKTYTASNNTTDGNIVFDPIGFTLADAGKEFDFQMKETSKDGNGIVTDKKVHDIKVTVKDNGDGTLKITPEYDGGKVKQIVFDNHAVGDLEVSKKVTGTGDKQKEFHFTVTLSDRSVDGTYGQMTFRNGVASITLKDGQTLKAENLPDDITYNVVEKEANRSGYTTKSENANGKITEGQVKKVLFVNDRKDISPNTGDHNHTAGWTSLMFSSLILALFTLIVRRKYSQ